MPVTGVPAGELIWFNSPITNILQGNQMKFSDIFKFMPVIKHIYAGVTDEQQQQLTQDSWAVEISGIKYVGTLLPVDVLSQLELAGVPEVIQVVAPALGEFQTSVMSPSTDPDTNESTEVWTVVTLPDDQIKLILQERVTAQRWAVETGGMVLANGMLIGTTVEDQNRISNVVLNAQRMGISSVDFKSKSGWATVPLATIVDIADAITTHVQAGFTAEKSHHDAIVAIEALDDTSAYEQLSTYDISTGWPV
jgi:hypothetical protein